MKKWSLIIVTMLLVVFIFSTLNASAGRPDPAGTIQCNMNIATEGAGWYGNIEDCELEGDVEFHAVLEEYFFPGNTWHYVETFIIHPTGGGELTGKDYGVWNVATLKFRANGWISGASEEWSDYVGYHFQEMGTTTPLEVKPVVADNTMVKLAPAGGRR